MKFLCQITIYLMMIVFIIK